MTHETKINNTIVSLNTLFVATVTIWLIYIGKNKRQSYMFIVNQKCLDYFYYVYMNMI